MQKVNGPVARSGAGLASLLLAGVASLALSSPAKSLTFTNDFETSWTMVGGAPAAATASILAVEAEYSADFSNPVNVSIKFGWGDVNGSPLPSGAAAGPILVLTGVPLATEKSYYATAVGLQPTNSVLATANANLPASYPNPGGNPTFNIGNADYKALNGTAIPGYPVGTDDSAAGFATNFCGGGNCPYDFTGGTPAANAIDFRAVAEHEISHAMGRVDEAPPGTPGGAPANLTALDFFKYAMSGGSCTKTLDPKNDITCFSFDGGATNPLGRVFSNFSDPSDWTGATGDSYNFAIGQGQFASVSSADIQEMCALGWNNCAAAVPAPMIGFGFPAFLAVGGLLFGVKLMRRSRGCWKSGGFAGAAESA